MRGLVPAALMLTAACRLKGPPPNFAPDPGLVAQIRELRISTSARACPGETFGALYTAVLNDGTLIPFESRYEEKHPPRLHVVFLDRRSDEATPLQGGAWAADPDPLTSTVTGFRLTATLKANPTVTATAAVAPDYGCLPHTFGFRGAGASASGPQVTVRLGILRSPFYLRLLVAGVEVEEAPPFFVLADAGAVPPSDWLIIEARGARGARGEGGQNGTDGPDGRTGCPGTAGAPGGAGGDGGPGGPGGARGQGGRGGKGGAASPANDPRCTAGPNGAAGRTGADGQDSRTGLPGTRPQRGGRTI